MNQARILYIEDEPVNRMLVQRVLAAEGYRVEEAQDGPSGLEKARQCSPDLILLDINLPGIDGYQMAEKLRAIPGMENIPIVALTANVMEGDRERSIGAGCNGYIQKPIDVDKLPDQIRAFLGQSQRRA
ncbi:MAG: response regulator [Anaerolineae bacterium]|nr:response regulator [Anaerolineae bacterium]